MAKVDQLLSLIEDSTRLLGKSLTNLKKCPKQRLTQGYIESRMKCVDEYWLCLKSAHQELLKITTKQERASMSYFTNEDFDNGEDIYLTVTADLRDMLQTKSTTEHYTSDEPSDSKNIQVRLPKITLPMFSGKYEEWTTFQDLFRALVHENGAISDVQKLHYLKTSITGEAQALLKHINVTEANYTQAWETLKQRYGNRRVIVASILNRLFHQKKASTPSAQAIKSLLDTTTECLNNIQNLKIDTDSWDPLIIFLSVQKLDPESHRGWEEFVYKQDSDILPSWDDMKRFLESKFRTLELVTSSMVNRERLVREKSFHIATTERKCILCEDSHTLSHCKEFGKMSPEERNMYVTNNKRCYNCLMTGHSVQKCRVPVNCRVCHKRHHSLLHTSKKVDMTSDADTTSQPKVSSHSTVEEHENMTHSTTIASNFSSKQGTALLATAMVTLKNNSGNTIVVRALIDQGSQACFVSEKVAQLLKLKRQNTTGSVIGVGSTRMNINHVVELEVLPKKETESSLHIQAYVLSKQLTTQIPHHTIPINNWPHLEGLELADTRFYTPGSIDLLLGVREYAEILQPELIKGPPGTPCAQRTNLGWILFGAINRNDNRFLVMHHQVNVDEMLKTLWEVDTNAKRLPTREEKQCEEIYNNTHTRNKEGRYVVKLPFKTENPQSPKGNTREIAIKRLLQLER